MITRSIRVTHQSQRSVCEHEIMLVRRFDAFGIHDTAARCRNVLHAALSCSVDVVGEWEESIGRASNASELLHVPSFLVGGQRSRNFFEQTLPLSLLCALGLECLTCNEQVDSVGFVGSLGALLEWEGQDSRVVAEPPVVRLLTRKTSAMDTGLLTRTKTNNSAIQGVTDTVGLGVLEGQGGDSEIDESLLGHLLSKSRSFSQLRSIT